MQKHASNLRSISVKFDCQPSVPTLSVALLLDPISSTAPNNLCSLTLNGNWLVGRHLSSLTSLTSLSLRLCNIEHGAQTSMFALQQLRNLDLSWTSMVSRRYSIVGLDPTPRNDTSFISALSTSLVQLTRLNLEYAYWVPFDDYGALRSLPHLQELLAWGWFVPARLTREFVGLRITSIRIEVNKADKYLPEVRAWLQQGGAGNQLSPLSGLRSLGLGRDEIPFSSLSIGSWASKLVQLTKLEVKTNSLDEVCRAFDPPLCPRESSQRCFIR